MIKEIYKYQFPVFKIEAAITVFNIFVALLLANAIWETTVLSQLVCSVHSGHLQCVFGSKVRKRQRSLTELSSQT